jgi:hypothetical protein
MGADNRWRLEDVAGRTFAAKCSMGDGWTVMLEIGTGPGELCKVAVRTEEFEGLFSEARS